ncbi:MAG: extracellular solute-binding protein [Candidatus Neoclostridium sp.]
MKKLLTLLLAVVMAVPVWSFAACSDGNRAEQLKMYVPGEYIDSEIFEEFEEWYKEKTGKTVKVVAPTTFDAVEEILTAVEKDHTDFDLLLPSDYAVEQLIKKDLLVKVDKQRVDVNEVFRSEYVERAKISDPTLEYSVPYMYGTFGIMYDYSKTGKHLDSWAAIYGNEFAGKCANKDSLREAITSAAIWNNASELTKDEVYDNGKLQTLYDRLPETYTTAIATLNSTKKNYLWGGESMKFDMASGNTKVQVALMWSCDAGYIMNDYEDDDGNEHTGNRNLWYVVPKEGGNIYLDNFVISKYGKNQEAAQYFLEFICQKEIAIRNSEYAGAVSPVKEAYDELYEQYVTDESIGEGAAEGWREMYLDMLFPSEETLARCGTMRDFGELDGAISEAWSNARG